MEKDVPSSKIVNLGEVRSSKAGAPQAGERARSQAAPFSTSVEQLLAQIGRDGWQGDPADFDEITAELKGGRLVDEADKAVVQRMSTLFDGMQALTPRIQSELEKFAAEKRTIAEAIAYARANEKLWETKRAHFEAVLRYIVEALMSEA